VLNRGRQIFQASPKDIEDLAIAGRMAGVCPYFGSRRAIPQAEVCEFVLGFLCTNAVNVQLVTLPYNLLLSKTARDALGIDLTNQVVIIDEAHSKQSYNVSVRSIDFLHRSYIDVTISLGRSAPVSDINCFSGSGVYLPLQVSRTSHASPLITFETTGYVLERREELCRRVE
jgi:hypothetical protein